MSDDDMNGDEKRRVEALKSLAEWGKWTVSIQALSVVVLAVGKDHLFSGGVIRSSFLIAAICFIFLSISAAILLVGGIPTAIQNKYKDGKEDKYERIHDYPAHSGIPFLTFRVLAFFEHFFFWLALLALMLSLVVGSK
ncbi:MAG: hypothetical protein AAGI37_07855 [Planctomycetota bacterium]